MLRNDYTDQVCAIAGTLELIGERWTLLIIRDAFLGIRRFEHFQRNLGIARNVLQTRLERLVDAGILRRERYQERPERFEYRLTTKGIELWPVLVSLMKWGDRHLYPEGPPVMLVHKECGGEVDDHRMCDRCGAPLEAWDVEPQLGPGAAVPHDAQSAPATG
jgi:DNA-binding HxlR family transcriptional regulator